MLEDPVGGIDPWGLAVVSELEAHFILGIGGLNVTCVDENFNIKNHIYIKICLGATFGASGSFGYVTNSDRKSCSSPPINLFGGEFGVSFVFGIDGSIVVDTKGTGIATSLSGASSIPTKVGLETKAIGCYYRLIYSY